jgi:23S rRNA-/tRNA-specific pseudouridylate synthase
LVHRIDKNTQGILLVAKSQKDLEFFQNQFKSRNVTKKYLCIVDGVLGYDFVIKGFQTKHHNNVKKQIWFWDQESATKYDPKSRYSESHIRPLAICYELGKTLLEVEIKTGRMHQIRLHCQTLGFPLSNDLVYNSNPQGIQKFYQSDEQFETGWTKKISKHDVTELSKNQFNALKNETFAGHDYCLLSNVLSLKIPGEKNLNVEYFDIAKHLKKLKSE